MLPFPPLEGSHADIPSDPSVRGGWPRAMADQLIRADAGFDQEADEHRRRRPHGDLADIPDIPKRLEYPRGTTLTLTPW